MREVWNRAQGALTQEPEVGAGAMHFVYGTAFGRLLARGILCRRFVSQLYAYRLGELLADDALAERFLGGWCLIFRLSPDDYHRYAYPDTGTQEPTVRIPGVLHSVNPIAGSLGVYRRNARARTLLHTEHFGDIVQMEVGAMLVGRICNHETGAAACARLQEKGYFEYGGSTVILLLEHGKFEPAADIAKWSARGIESKVKTGDPVGRRP